MKLLLMVCAFYIAHMDVKAIVCYEGKSSSDDVELNISNATVTYCNAGEFPEYNSAQCLTRFNENGKLISSYCAFLIMSCVDDNYSAMSNACKKTDVGKTCCCSTDYCLGDGAEYGPIDSTARKTLQAPNAIVKDALRNGVSNAAPSTTITLFCVLVLFASVILSANF